MKDKGFRGVLVLTLCLLGLLLPSPSRSSTHHPKTSTYDMERSKASWQSLEVGDPISASSGQFHFSMTFFRLGGPFSLEYQIVYRDMNTWTPANFFLTDTPWVDNLMGLGVWVMNWGQDDNWLYFVPDPSTGGWKLEEAKNPLPVKYQLKETDDYFYLMDPSTERVYIFKKEPWETYPAHLYYVFDRNGNKHTYTYSGVLNDLTKIEDDYGRYLEFIYDGVLQKVRDFCGREVIFERTGNLITSITNPNNETTTFVYSSNDNSAPLLAIKGPEGNTPYTNTYDNDMGMRWVTTQTDALGNITSFSYSQTPTGDCPPDLTETKPDNHTRVYKHSCGTAAYGPPKELKDEAGKRITFNYQKGQLATVTDRMGGVTSFTYHQESGKVASITNARGKTINFTYTAQERTITNPENGEQVAFTYYNLTQVTYPDGTSKSFEYDSHGNVTRFTDRAGKVWRFEYNARGQVTKITNPAGGETTYTYNDDGTLASSTDSDTGVTTYEYDECKRMVKINHPDGTFTQITYDNMDRITSITNEKGKTYTFEYDKNGNLKKITDPAGKSYQLAYDAMDRLAQIINRRGKAYTFEYNELGLLESFRNPLGHLYQMAYDPREWLASLTNPLGKVQQWGYDDEGMVTSYTTPLGRRYQFVRDELGRVQQVTDPEGHTTTYTWDYDTNRIVKETNPLGREINYSYDQRGLPSSISQSLLSVNVQHNDLGLLSRIQDPKGNNWDFSYTPMGRLSSLKDPLSHEWQFSYDQRGYLQQVTYPDGETQDITRDETGRVTRRQFSSGLDLQYTYDDLGHLTSANGVEFSYNEEGQITETRNPPVAFGATYDDAGRLASVSYANGLFTVTYTYDELGRLTSVSDSRSHTTINFSYDDDGHLVGIDRPGQVADTSFQWTDGGRINRITHGQVADLQYTYNAANEPVKVDYTLPLDPADHLSSGTDTFTYDAANQLTSPAYGYDERGRLIQSPQGSFQWDGASRLVQSPYASMTYNGLGQVVTRNDGQKTVHYHYNYALGFNSIVAEKDEATGQWIRFYVLTPGGILLYSLDGTDPGKVSFYFFDRRGNTLFLMDQNGNITDKYAYTPYGILLAHEGSSDQPFTFQGAYQTRYEGGEPSGALRAKEAPSERQAVAGPSNEGNLYQMGSRYYDPLTARFISRDPGWPNICPRDVNPYQYARQQPIVYADRTGENPEEYDWDLTPEEEHLVEMKRIDPVYPRELRSPWDLTPDLVNTPDPEEELPAYPEWEPSPSEMAREQTLRTFKKEPGTERIGKEPYGEASFSTFWGQRDVNRYLRKYWKALNGLPNIPVLPYERWSPFPACK